MEFHIPDINLPNRVICSSVLSCISYILSSQVILSFYLEYTTVKYALFLTPLLFVIIYFLLKSIKQKKKYDVNRYTIMVYLSVTSIAVIWSCIYLLLKSSYSSTNDLIISYLVVLGITMAVWYTSHIIFKIINKHIDG